MPTEGEQNNEGQGTDAQGTQAPAGEAVKPAEQNNDQGFPEGTPWRDMTLGQQVEYWKAQSRKHEGRANSMADYSELKAKAEKLAEIEAANMTEQQKAVADAAKEARESTLREVGSRLVDAQFTVAAAGRMDEERLKALLDGVDRSRFMKDDGSADADRVKAFVDSVAPQQKQQEQRHEFGQGSRQGSTVPSVEAGMDLYKQLHPQPTSS